MSTDSLWLFSLSSDSNQNLLRPFYNAFGQMTATFPRTWSSANSVACGAASIATAIGTGPNTRSLAIFVGTLQLKNVENPVSVLDGSNCLANCCVEKLGVWHANVLGVGERDSIERRIVHLLWLPPEGNKMEQDVTRPNSKESEAFEFGCILFPRLEEAVSNPHKICLRVAFAKTYFWSTFSKNTT